MAQARRDWMIELRERKRLTIEQMAKQCDVSAQLISYIEHGSCTLPPLAIQIADGYGMTDAQCEAISKDFVIDCWLEGQRATRHNAVDMRLDLSMRKRPKPTAAERSVTGSGWKEFAPVLDPSTEKQPRTKKQTAKPAPVRAVALESKAKRRQAQAALPERNGRPYWEYRLECDKIGLREMARLKAYCGKAYRLAHCAGNKVGLPMADGEAINALRLEHGWRRIDLEAEAECSPHQIQNAIESKRIQWSTAVGIANALGCALWDILQIEEEQHAEP